MQRASQRSVRRTLEQIRMLSNSIAAAYQPHGVATRWLVSSRSAEFGSEQGGRFKRKPGARKVASRNFLMAYIARWVTNWARFSNSGIRGAQATTPRDHRAEVI